MVQWMNAPKPKPEDIIPKDNKAKDNKPKDNKPNNNKPPKTIDLSEDDDKNFGFLFCVFLITLGLIFNKLTYEIFQPTITNEQMYPFWNPWYYLPLRLYLELVFPFVFLMKSLIIYLNFLIGIVENIDGTITKCEIPAYVVIFMFGFMIILSAMLPKMTMDKCKKFGKIIGHHGQMLMEFSASAAVSV